MRGLQVRILPGALEKTLPLKSSLDNSHQAFEGPRTPVYGCFRPVLVVFESVLGPPTSLTTTFSTAWLILGFSGPPPLSIVRYNTNWKTKLFAVL
jgi:hypothetical protein